MKAETFFSEQDKENISQTIQAIETRTAGEVAVMVVDKSDTYPEAHILGGTVLGSLLCLVVLYVLDHPSLTVFVPAAGICSCVIGYLLKYLPAALRAFIPPARLESQVQKRALIAFYEKELYKTRDDTGVLFFLSLLEHKVWVLADKGIYEKISQEELQKYASEVALGVKTGETAPILCQQIQAIGTVLAEHFPIKADDTNELANEVIVGRS